MDIDININNSSDDDNDAHAVPPSLLASTSQSLSYSRAARLRATTTDEEGEEEEEHSEDDDDDDDDDDATTALQVELSLLGPTSVKASSRKDGGTSKTTSRSFITTSKGERYLQASSTPAKTSSNKLSDTIKQPFSQKSLLHYLARRHNPQQHPSSKGKLTQRQLREIEQSYIQLFPQWLAELQQGYTLLFHGLGSKIRLLNLFVQTALKAAVSSKRVLLLDGFKADLSISDIVSTLESILIPQEEIASNPLYYTSKTASRIDERISSILDRLDNTDANIISPAKPIYMLLHSLDGPALRSPRSQATIWNLANHPCVRLIASFDHTKAPLLLPSTRTASSLANSNRHATGPRHASGHPIIYHHVPTLRPYTVESLSSGCLSALCPQTVFLSELHLLQSKQGGMRHASSASRAKAAAFVLASLTQKAKDLFQSIATQQMARAEEGDVIGEVQVAGQAPSFALPYSTIFVSARDAFLANNVGQMEALLREFRDHEIILSSNIAPVDQEGHLNRDASADLGQKGNEWLWINIGTPDLQSLVDDLAL
ncbi:ORC2-domain-containing protein [Cystobasidium minutum MCA 4210]|uniref:ORC2-domain-containing protein n=1 Tax=Cystobasidium minutum MCA 4210 TaxID=1397322 RepID=UPI0034CFBC32|eukprot:jgi/Rhomi1/193347/gm1.1561_g